MDTIRVFNARSCAIREIHTDLSVDFVKENHHMGFPSPGKRLISYGIFFEEELLGVAQFCNPRTAGMQKKYTRELLRLAFKKNVRVRGGASKLIKFFLKNNAVVDLFTYQDTSGKASDVYERSGMKLVSKRFPKKKVLVKNGITFDKAENNRKDWFSMEQATSRGPDALLKTDLGEVYREDGSRKTNLDLFIEHCDYHIEEIPGDRIYEWRNPKVNFYTYKITSTVDDGYYLGRKTIWLESPTKEDCRNDGYMGSGGSKFTNWVSKVGFESLEKEVLKIHKTWKSVLESESKLIGSLHVEDPNCKNKMPGGLGRAASFPPMKEKTCETHGVAKHVGETCLRCASEKSYSIEQCPIHGESKHQGGNCLTCNIEKSFWKSECPIHGLTVHRKSGCLKCIARETHRTGLCRTHGERVFVSGKCRKCLFNSTHEMEDCLKHGPSYHKEGVCLRCTSEESFSLKRCEKHGEVTHRGDTCLTCVSEKTFSSKICKIHGEVTFRGDRCTKCQADSTKSLRMCEVHGMVTHWGKNCSTCSSEKIVKKGTCEIHGEVTFIGDKCRVCINQRTTTKKICPVHGESTHQGETCLRCASSVRFNERECKIHGLTSHNGSTCVKCTISKRVKKGVCKIHGEATFNNGQCAFCQSHKQFSQKQCDVHGLSKFKGSACCKCTAEKTAHKRFHLKNPKSGCRLCVEESLITPVQ